MITRLVCIWTRAVIALVLATNLATAEEAKPSPIELAKTALAKAAAERGTARKTAEAKAAAASTEAQKAAAAKAAADKLGAEKAATEKVLVEKAAALKAESDKLAAANAASQKAASEKVAAEKDLAAKETAVRAAEETILAEEAFAASEALNKAISDRAKAEKALNDKSAALQKKAGDPTAIAEKAAAEKALADVTATLPSLRERVAVTNANLVSGLKPLAGIAWDYAKARHLLWRAGFGGTADEVTKLHAMGLHAAVTHLVDFQKLPEPACSVDIRLPEPATVFENRLTEPARSKLGNERTSRRFQQLAQLRYWWLRRMVETQRPLEEKLALFWHGHFAVNFTKNENPHAMWRQNRLFRDYAAGKFGGLLRGIAQDPAMIAYLDNQVNFKGAGNENLGREILELFSMGEGQGYSEQDLREASRALTGYSYEHSTGLFKLIATRHDETPKTIFGRAGNWGGDDLVDMILQQPPTARFIATKLFHYFAHQNPAPETIDRLANVLRVTNYDLSAMLENLFLSEEFYSPTAMASHIKSPVELMIGTLRTLGATDIDYGAVDGALQTMGQTLFEPPNVKGWDGGRDWINTSRLLVRYNSVVGVADRGNVDLAASLESKGLCASEPIVEHFAKSFLVMPLGDAKRAEIVRFLGQLPPQPEWAKQRDALNTKLRAALATLLSTPEYQLN